MPGMDSGDQIPHVNCTSKLKTSPHPSEGHHGTHFSTSQIGQPTCPVPLCVQTPATMLLCNRMPDLLQNPETFLFCHSQGQNDCKERQMSFEYLLACPPGDSAAQSGMGFPTSINKTTQPRHSHKTT